MTRMEEYQALRQELETVPEDIETLTNRALAREKACRKKKRIWGVPVGSLAACFALFLLLVNCFPTFAAACEGLPVLGELAEALRFDKSLRLAVENEYVQPLGLSQTENGITARSGIPHRGPRRTSTSSSASTLRRPFSPGWVTVRIPRAASA